jgi:capsular polysaccharide biosynthesis protein
MGFGVNVGVNQNISPIASTGQKYFGTGLAAASVPNPNAPNRNQNIYIAGILGLAAAVGIFLYYKR